MHHERKVGTNVSNPHSSTTYIMLNSTFLCMRFKDAEAARKCCKVAASYPRYHIIGCLVDETLYPHAVYIEMKSDFLYLSHSDISMLADFRDFYDYDLLIQSFIFLPHRLKLAYSWQS